MKEEIEQLKRDLKSHGQYKKWIVSINNDLERIALEFKDCEVVSGISFEEKTSTSDAYRSPRMLELISDETHMIRERGSLEKKIKDLDIENKMKVLNHIEDSVIRSIYFEGLSFRYIAEQLDYSKSNIDYYNERALKKMLKDRTRPID